ncbi:unnamed protein product [Rhizophagus irregularis]|nr:unnamed protein product [Rhizophagus irregularis]
MSKVQVYLVHVVTALNEISTEKASPTTLQQVVTCQPTLTTYSTNSPYCTEHRLLSLRKHFENVRRHRISRRKAREDYVRALEVKAQILKSFEGRNNDDSLNNVVISNGLSASNNHGDENNDATV